MSSLSIRRKIQSRTREFSPKPGQRNFPWKESKFPSDSLMKQIPRIVSFEEKQCKVSFRDGMYWTLCYIYFDYFLCLLLCKLIKSFMCTQSNIYKCCSAVIGPCFTELLSPFTAFEFMNVALLSIQVSWKLCCCFVSLVPYSSHNNVRSYSKMPGCDILVKLCEDVKFKYRTFFFFSVQHHC